ncbi:MAG: DUF1385 domain-containing protein [Ruminococcaceae bacterium]|nr:DUF1385 domain-containing protein [Oscillospiraceae bacterium]
MSNKEKICAAKKTSIGGQALMEGIMMRGPKVTAMAVRNTKGEIILEKEPTQSANAPKIFKLPIFRGLYNYIYSMKTGSKYLMRSAELSGLEELEEEMQKEKEAKKAAKKAEKLAKKGIAPSTEAVAEKTAEENTVVENTVAEDISVEGSLQQPAETNGKTDKDEKKNGSVITTLVMVIGVVLGIVLAVGLFVVLPSYIYNLIKLIPAIGQEDNVALRSLYKSLFEGIIRIVLLVGYMAAIALMKDIRRTFMYHGAEHKTIFCYEAGLELTVENVRKQKKYHPRCGTSFLILMVLVSIFVSFFIDPVYSLITGSPEMPTLMRVIFKLLLIPLIVGIGYELLKIAGRHNNIVTRVISAPGVWLQHITVYEPTDDMIECAIAAMKEVIPENENDDNW